MDSWQKGRGDLFEELTKICNQIEGNISSELSDNSTTKIGNEELRLLRETSDRAEKLTEHNARLADELKKCRVASSRVEVLENENKRLAEALAGDIQQRAGSTTPAPFMTPGPSKISAATPGFTSSGTESTSSRTVSWEQHRSLIEKYNKVCENWADLKVARDRLERQSRIDKQNVQIWKKHFEDARILLEKKDVKYQKLKEEIQGLRAPLDLPSGSFGALENGGVAIPPLLLERGEPEAPISSESSKNREKHITLVENSTDMIPSFSGSEHANYESSHPLPDSPELPTNTRRSSVVEDTEFESRKQVHTSSTQEISDPISPPKIKEEHSIETLLSPDTPIVISARSVKKRKQHSNNDDSTSVARVKIEISSSSPRRFGFQDSNFHESMDLDDIGEKVDTPRKQRHTLQDPYQADDDISYSPRIQNQRQHQDISSTNLRPLSDFYTTPSHRIALQPRSTNARVLPRTSTERPTKKRRVTLDKVAAELVEDGELDMLERAHRHISELGDRLQDLLEKPSPKSPVLNLKSPNALWERNGITSGLAQEVTVSPQAENINQRLYVGNPTRTSGSPSRPSSRGVAHYAEELSRPVSKGSLRESLEQARPTSKSSSRSSTDTPRLRSSRELLQNARPSPDESGYFSASTRGPTSVSKDPSRYLPRQPASSKFSPSISHLRRSKFAPEVDPDEEPIRVRPLNRLSLRDFKVNPNYNQGYNFAFKEVVRGVEARKCLQGCTRPDCCGPKFRALAEASRNPDIPPTLSQEEREDAILEDFTGHNAYKIQNMSKAEREEVLLQAKTRELANRLGKHRQAYERRASPPGFWRVDFPSTQEQEEDRERAKEQERATIAQRYAEAMRPGGAYMFRDE